MGNNQLKSAMCGNNIDLKRTSNIPQTVLALRGSDGFSRDLWRCAGVSSRSLGARSCCKNRYLVTLTFVPLERNRWSRAQIHKNSMLFDNFLVHGSPQHPTNPGAAGGSLETGQVSPVKTRQMSQQQSSVLSASRRPAAVASSVETG